MMPGLLICAMLIGGVAAGITLLAGGSIWAALALYSGCGALSLLGLAGITALGCRDAGSRQGRSPSELDSRSNTVLTGTFARTRRDP